MSEEKAVTARKELYDHLKYLVGSDEANKMINEYKKEILEEINFYKLRNRLIGQLKEKLIETITEELHTNCFKSVQILRRHVPYARYTEECETHALVDKTEVIETIKDVLDREIIEYEE